MGRTGRKWVVAEGDELVEERSESECGGVGGSFVGIESGIITGTGANGGAHSEKQSSGDENV